MEDLTNYKGIYYGDTNEKYIDPDTGAHFRYRDLCGRMAILEKNRGNLMNGTETLFPDITEEIDMSSEEEESMVAAEQESDADVDASENQVLPREMSKSSSGLSGNISCGDLDENLEVKKVFQTTNYDFT